MKAKLIYCTNCKEITLQLPLTQEQTSYECNCGTKNKTKANQITNETDEKEQGKDDK